MSVELTAALIASITSIVVVVASHLLTSRLAARTKKWQINSQYLNPLRLFAEEVYYRLFEIRFESGASDWLRQSIDRDSDLSDRDEEWFAGAGCYLMSSCYFTACLFATITSVRRDIPYLRLGRNDDTELLRLTFRVSRAFLRDLGVFYVTQHTMGRELHGKDGLLGYREFCQLVKRQDDCMWFSQLLRFYLALAAKDERALTRLDEVLDTIWDLGTFIDRAVKGGRSIEARLLSEGWLNPPSRVDRFLRTCTGNRLPRAQNPIHAAELPRRHH